MALCGVKKFHEGLRRTEGRKGMGGEPRNLGGDLCAGNEKHGKLVFGT